MLSYILQIYCFSDPICSLPNTTHTPTSCRFLCSIPERSWSCKRRTDINFLLESKHGTQRAALENLLNPSRELRKLSMFKVSTKGGCPAIFDITTLIWVNLINISSPAAISAFHLCRLTIPFVTTFPIPVLSISSSNHSVIAPTLPEPSLSTVFASCHTDISAGVPEVMYTKWEKNWVFLSKCECE